MTINAIAIAKSFSWEIEIWISLILKSFICEIYGAPSFRDKISISLNPTEDVISLE